MKTLYRISIFFNCIGMAFVLIHGSELLTKEWLSKHSDGENVQQAAEPQAGSAFKNDSYAKSTVKNDVQTEAAAVNDADMGGSAFAQDTQTADADRQKERLQTVESDINATTTCDTVYHILICDLTQGTEREEIADIPLSYTGKSRQQLIDLFGVYNDSPPLEELGKGFQGMELVSFSKSDITVRKTYETKLHFCCVIVEDGYLTVYDEKRENVILYTDISMEHLSQELQQEIMDGKYFDTEQQLYTFLESYSS